MADDLENPLFFLLDITNGLVETPLEMNGLRSSDMDFAESLGKWYVSNGKFSTGQERALRGLLKRYSWQTRHMPEDFVAEDSGTYYEWRFEHEKAMARARVCLITDD